MLRLNFETDGIAISRQLRLEKESFIAFVCFLRLLFYFDVNVCQIESHHVKLNLNSFLLIYSVKLKMINKTCENCTFQLVKVTQD